MNSASETVGSLTMQDGTIGSPGTLTLNGASPTIVYNGLATGAVISTTTVALGTSAGTTTFDVSDGAAAMDLTISSSLVDGTGVHSVTKTGAGTLQLTGSSSFTGPLDISAGTLSVSSINATAAANQTARKFLGGNHARQQ